MWICKGVCVKLGGYSKPTATRFIGSKFCSQCNVSFDTEETHCPCCRTHFKSKTKSRKNKPRVN